MVYDPVSRIPEKMAGHPRNVIGLGIGPEITFSAWFPPSGLAASLGDRLLERARSADTSGFVPWCDTLAIA